MIAFNFQSTTRITFSAVGFRRFFIRIQFKTLKLVVISYFYKVFVRFSSHSTQLILMQFLNYSAEENPCWIIYLRF